MIDTLLFGKNLKKLGFDFYSGVPCSYQTSLINYAVNYFDFVMSSNEGDAVAICSGAALSGKKPVVLMQNSGLGNAVSPLTSLNYTFKIPILGFVSHRGQPKITDEPQHKLMGEITTGLLDLMKIKWTYLSKDTKTANKQLLIANENIKNGNSFFFLVSKNTFQEHNLLKDEKINENLVSRNEVISLLLKLKNDKIIFLGTTGKTGREMFEINDIKNSFYMIGSMGCISSLTLGIGLNSKKKSIIIDGDGSVLMRMGNLPTIGYYKPSNIFHLMLDNNSHDSTGGQFTVSNKSNFVKIAENSGYINSQEVKTLNELEKVLTSWIKNPVLTFVYFKISKGSKKNLGRPTVSPENVANRFKKFINDK